MHDKLAQCRQCRFELAPDPACQVFAGRIFQARNVVETMMIEPLEQGLERSLHVSEVHYPSRFRARLALDMDFDAERVSVQARAFVSGWNIRQPVRGFDLEGLENIHSIITRRRACFSRTVSAAGQ